MQARLDNDLWSGPVTSARGFRQRLKGLRDAPGDAGLLIESRSVHGFGMDRSLLVVALDSRLTVLGSRVMAPGRVVWFPHARFLLELPADVPVPAVGTRLVVEDG